MSDFVALCKRIIETDGHPTEQDVLNCGYDASHFARISNHNIKATKLVSNARQALLDRGIYYKVN